MWLRPCASEAIRRRTSSANGWLLRLRAPCSHQTWRAAPLAASECSMASTGGADARAHEHHRSVAGAQHEAAARRARVEDVAHAHVAAEIGAGMTVSLES